MCIRLPSPLTRSSSWRLAQKAPFSSGKPPLASCAPELTMTCQRTPVPPSTPLQQEVLVPPTRRSERAQTPTHVSVNERRAPTDDIIARETNVRTYVRNTAREIMPGKCDAAAYYLGSSKSPECWQPKATKQPVGEVEGSYEPHQTQNGLIGMDNLTSYFAPAHPHG